MKQIKKILEETPISIAEVKTLLEKAKERDKELSFRANKTYEYTIDVEAIDHKKVKELYNKLKKLGVSRLKEEHIVKLIDILPDKADEVKMTLSAYPLTISKKDLEALAKTLSEYT